MEIGKWGMEAGAGATRPISLTETRSVTMLTSPNAPNSNHSELGIRYSQLPLRGSALKVTLVCSIAPQERPGQICVLADDGSV